jgi:hypothetical protein
VGNESYESGGCKWLLGGNPSCCTVQLPVGLGVQHSGELQCARVKSPKA